MKKALAVCVVLAVCGLTGADDKKNPKFSDLDHMQGTWVVSEVLGFGGDTTPAELKDLKLVIKDREMTVKYGDKTVKATFTLNQDGTPQQMDVKITDGPDEVKGKSVACIYLLEGTILKVAFRDPGEKRPSEFITRNRTDFHEIRFKKEKSAGK